jgi:hypothetical protein
MASSNREKAKRESGLSVIYTHFLPESFGSVRYPRTGPWKLTSRGMGGEPKNIGIDSGWIEGSAAAPWRFTVTGSYVDVRVWRWSSWMTDITISYRFTLEDGAEEFVELALDSKTLSLRTSEAADLPPWTELGFRQCPDCPLQATTTPHCPAAAGLVGLVRGFARVLSYERIKVEVCTPERTVTLDTSAQQAVSSLMGLIMAVSGCPFTAFFRPMARFHLPGATTDETIYRAASMYMLAQYYVHFSGNEPDFAFAGLLEKYEAVQKVNRAFVKRLHAAADYDSTINALVVLDAWALTIPWAVEESLAGFRHLFEPYLP